MTTSPADCRVAVVTGSSGGLGSAMAIRLAEDGFRIVLHYHRAQETAAALASQIAELDVGEPMTLQADLRDSSSAGAMFRTVQRELGRIDVLVNNSGIRNDASFLLSNQDTWWDVVRTNLGSVANCSRAVLPIMASKHSGRVINITSLSGLRGTQGQTAYSASKAAILGFSKALAREVSHLGIAINCVAPGLIDTSMTRDLAPAHVEATIAMTPARRLGTAAEVAGVVSWLASPEAGYVIGQVISIDGGASM